VSQCILAHRDWHIGQLNGKHSKLVERIDRLDEMISPFVDKILEALEFGFIMMSISTKLSSILDYDKSQRKPLPVPFNKLNGKMWGVELKSCETIADCNADQRRSPLFFRIRKHCMEKL